MKKRNILTLLTLISVLLYFSSQSARKAHRTKITKPQTAEDIQQRINSLEQELKREQKNCDVPWQTFVRPAACDRVEELKQQLDEFKKQEAILKKRQ